LDLQKVVSLLVQQLKVLDRALLSLHKFDKHKDVLRRFFQRPTDLEDEETSGYWMQLDRQTKRRISSERY
jgi:hypothetical protein